MNQMNGDSNIRALPHWLQLPAWLALVRACTAGQAARYLYSSKVNEAEVGLDTLVSRKRYVGKIGPIKLPRQFGEAAKAETYVYYLTQKGLDALVRIAPQFARHAKAGRPMGANVNRLPHELLITEAWLWQIREQREVLEFVPETELKRALVKRRTAVTGGSVGTATLNEATGDFKIHVRDRAGSADWWIEGEAAVRYSPSQIKAKPDRMDWFVCDNRVAQLIETQKGIRPYILGDVRIPNLHEPPKAKTSGRPAPTREAILTAIKTLGGAITATCAQAMVGSPRNYASHVLKMLADAGRLQIHKTSILLGVDEGRPISLYADPDLIIRRATDIAHHTWVTQFVIDAWRKGFEVERCDSKGVLHLQAEDNPAIKLTAIVDSPSITVGDFYARLEAIAPSLSERSRVAIVMADPQRIIALRNFYPGAKIHNLTSSGHVQGSSTPSTSSPVTGPPAGTPKHYQTAHASL